MSHDYKWLWCDDHAKVTAWFLTLTDRYDYNLFYPSYVNAAGRSFELFQRNKGGITWSQLQPFDRLNVECLLNETIPADKLIEALSQNQRVLGGTKGNLKGKGMIKFNDAAPGIYRPSLLLTNTDSRLKRYVGCREWRYSTLQEDQGLEEEKHGSG
jgi:hypothetical protein